MVAVDESLQEEFFRIVDAQLQSIAQFFRKEEIDLQCALSELEEKVGVCLCTIVQCVDLCINMYIRTVCSTLTHGNVVKSTKMWYTRNYFSFH